MGLAAEMQRSLQPLVMLRLPWGDGRRCLEPTYEVVGDMWIMPSTPTAYGQDHARGMVKGSTAQSLTIKLVGAANLTGL